MIYTYLLQALGSAGPFSTRVFLPALLTALLLRFGYEIPIVRDLGLVAAVTHHQPSWFTSDPCLIVLAMLSVLEIVAQKNVEARRLLTEFDIYIKPVMAALTSLGVIHAADAQFIGSTVHAGLDIDIFPLLSAFLTWRLSILRRQVATVVFDHLEGTHLDHLISWLEDAWAMFGTLLLVLLPALMLVMLVAVTAVLYLIRRQLRINEEHAKIICGGCSRSIYPSAVSCPSCKHSNNPPGEIGFLGQSKPFAASDPDRQPYRLVEKRRCPVCAAHRPPRQVTQPCPDCGCTITATEPFTRAYADYIAQRVPIVLGICFLMSLIPIFGLIASLVYSRMELVLPFSQYLPMSRNFMLRWGIRILFLILVFLQVIPVLGGFVGPLMAYISYVGYRNAYLSYLQSVSHQPASIKIVGIPAK